MTAQLGTLGGRRGPLDPTQPLGPGRLKLLLSGVSLACAEETEPRKDLGTHTCKSAWDTCKPRGQRAQ